jgi:hypothetical protein
MIKMNKQLLNQLNVVTGLWQMLELRGDCIVNKPSQLNTGTANFHLCDL